MPTLNRAIEVLAQVSGLTPEQKRRVETETIARPVLKGGFLCRKGQTADHWIGVTDGLAKLATISLNGKLTTFTGVPTGGWFGEGSLLKNEPRRYDAIALRDCQVAYLPRSTFLWLLDNNNQFARFLLAQFNERLGQFIGIVEHDRLLGPDGRVAHCLASLYNRTLYPGIEDVLNISQEEIGQLVGLSRQRANAALKVLEQAGYLQIEYRGITILSLDGLQRFEG
jgi:CRP-like cAMP-binding protein